MLNLLVVAAALVPQAPTSRGAAGHAAVATATAPAPWVPRAAAFAFAAAPFSAIAEGAALFENAAAPGDVGMRPTIGGVNLFVFYVIYQIFFQAFLRLRPGGANVAFINGTKTVNGKRLGDSPFDRTFDETVKAAAKAAKKMRDGKSGDQ